MLPNRLYLLLFLILSGSNYCLADGCGLQTVTSLYPVSDIVIKGIVCQLEDADSSGNLKVEIHISRNFKSSETEMTLYLSGFQGVYGSSGQDIELGDSIIVLHRSRYNRANLVGPINYLCISNYSVLKPADKYPNPQSYEANRNYFRYVEATLDWLTQTIPACQRCGNPIMINARRYKGLNTVNTQLVCFAVIIEDGRIVAYEFAEQLDAPTIERVKTIFQDARYGCSMAEHEGNQHRFLHSIILMKEFKAVIKI